MRTHTGFIASSLPGRGIDSVWAAGSVSILTGWLQVLPSTDHAMATFPPNAGIAVIWAVMA